MKLSNIKFVYQKWAIYCQGNDQTFDMEYSVEGTAWILQSLLFVLVALQHLLVTLESGDELTLDTHHHLQVCT